MLANRNQRHKENTTEMQNKWEKSSRGGNSTLKSVLNTVSNGCASVELEMLSSFHLLVGCYACLCNKKAYQRAKSVQI